MCIQMCISTHYPRLSRQMASTMSRLLRLLLSWACVKSEWHTKSQLCKWGSCVKQRIQIPFLAAVRGLSTWAPRAHSHLENSKWTILCDSRGSQIFIRTHLLEHLQLILIYIMYILIRSVWSIGEVLRRKHTLTIHFQPFALPSSADFWLVLKKKLLEAFWLCCRIFHWGSWNDAFRNPHCCAVGTSQRLGRLVSMGSI